MTVNSQRLLLAAAGAAAAGEGLYVDDVFSTYLYEGNGSTQTITNGIDLSGEGGLIWFKRRDAVGNNTLTDTVDNKRLITDSTNAQNPNALVSSFNSDGFSLNTSLTPNQSGSDYCSWTFRKAPGFFDIVTYTGNGTAGRTVAHNLGSVPGMIVIKKLDGTGNWAVHHRSLGNSNALYLHSTNASFSSPLFNNTTPTSTEFTLNNGGDVNGNGNSYVAYLFAHDDQSFGEDEDEAIIKCGTITTDGSGYVEEDLGFEPQWLMVKQTSGGGGDWLMFDVMRGFCARSGPTRNLNANSSNAEGDYPYFFVTPNGFEIDESSIGSHTFVYIAIRRPHKPPEAGTDVFAATTDNSQGDGRYAYLGKPVDFWIYQASRNTATGHFARARLTGGNYLRTDSTAAETSQAINYWDNMVGTGSGASTNTNAISWGFRRAAGVFDVVTYVGDGNNAQTLNHNLAVAPEFYLVKNRDDTRRWAVYHTQLVTDSRVVYLNENSSYSTSWTPDFVDPTATQFTVSQEMGGVSAVNKSGNDHIAYLFATLPGISKVGSYTGTGSNIGVNCGFTAGARFVLIKRTDSTGDWYVYDSTRGIVGGNDPYILLNSTAAEVTTTDYIDPLNSGFTVTSSAPAALNASGGTYIFLAIA